MDYEEIANISNLTFDNDVVTPEESSRFIVHEIIFGIFSLFGILADSAIIYAIFTFKRIRTVPNIFLANWAIADVFSLIVTPSRYKVISWIDHLSFSHECMCLIFGTGKVLHVGVVTFVFIAAIDWTLAAYFAKASSKFRKRHKYVIGTVWITLMVLCTTDIIYCAGGAFLMLPKILLQGTFSAVLIMAIALHTIRAVQKCRKKSTEPPREMLNLVTAFVLSYLVAFVNDVIVHLLFYHPLLAVFSACAAFSSAIVNFILLYCTCPTFNACFRTMLSCAPCANRKVSNALEEENGDLHFENLSIDDGMMEEIEHEDSKVLQNNCC